MKLTLDILALITLLLLSAGRAMNLKATKKCRALVLSGGGDMGSFEAGVLKAFTQYLPPEEVMYDVVTGVSVGAINAAPIAFHPIGKESDAADWMINMWGKLKSSNIYNSWSFGIPEGLLFREGLWDNSEELRYLKKTFDTFKDRQVFRKINMGAVDFNTGEVYKFTEEVGFSEIAQAVTASSSMPFAFNHAHINGSTYVDGGSVWNIDISGAIERCKEVVDSEEDIIIDVIMCNSVSQNKVNDTQEYNTLQNYMRYKQISGFYGKMGDYYEIMRGYPNVNFRYLVKPEQPLPTGALPIVFDHDNMLKMIEIGKEEGKKAIEKGENFYDNSLKEYLKNTMYHGMDLV